MKVIAKHNGRGFVGMMPDEATYDKVRDGIVDWKPHVKESITHYQIPKAVFERLAELDRERMEAEYRDV